MQEMEEMNCSLCDIELKDNDAAYGLTPGSIDEDSDGFRIDADSVWDVYRAECMNEIDRMISAYRQTRSK
ncbi:MAG: hypothetical protein U1D97_13730 [Desulfuromonadales bacterium]|nr:hypothetical protein [Desulfuromonadales bacterium]